MFTLRVYSAPKVRIYHHGSGLVFSPLTVAETRAYAMQKMAEMSCTRSAYSKMCGVWGCWCEG